MPYMEPGPYSKIVEQGSSGTGFTPALTPLYIGSGATILTRTEVITRGSGMTDTLPTNAQNIKVIGYTEGKADFTKDTDYKFTAGTDQIQWQSTGTPTPKVPLQGEKYLVTFSYDVDDTQFTPRLIYTQADIKKYYGTDTKTEEGGDVNPLAVALRIALSMGVSPVHAIQVKPNASKTVTAVEYQAALDTYAKFINTTWRIIPVDLDDAINGVIDGHVRICSTWEERLERTAIYGKSHATLTSADDVVNTVGGYAQSKQNRRVIVPYPDQVTMMLDDGNYYTLDAPFIAAAIAGLEAASPIEQSLTRGRIGIFNELKGVPMTRTQKNALAEKGVLVLEQPNGVGTDIIIRHGLTTDMSSIKSRESSIQGIEDFCSKYFRDVVEQYIGRYNITPDTITRVRGSLNSAIAQLSGNVIVSGEIKSLVQDADNPDTLLIEIIIQPPYACNYIKITLYVD